LGTGPSPSPSPSPNFGLQSESESESESDEMAGSKKLCHMVNLSAIQQYLLSQFLLTFSN
jgi:hypothetical protein